LDPLDVMTAMRQKEGCSPHPWANKDLLMLKKVAIFSAFDVRD
jgi:hypothetical protein